MRSSRTSKADYVDLNKRLMEASKASNQQIASLTVNSYASPEGSYEFNEQLARKREKNTTAYLENQLKKDKITEFGELTSSFTPEDWEGFQQLVENSNIQDKDLILSVLKMYKDPVQREQEIRNLSSVFNELADRILPQLRYSRVMATINVIGKSDRELVELFGTDPGKLTADEMLYVATLTDDNAKKMGIYKKSTEFFPNDYRTFNNLGNTQYVAGDYKVAQSSFRKALALNPQSKEAEMNMGLVAPLKAAIPTPTPRSDRLPVCLRPLMPLVCIISPRARLQRLSTLSARPRPTTRRFARIPPRIILRRAPRFRRFRILMPPPIT